MGCLAVDIKANLDYINSEIERYAKKDNVKLIVVTKTVGEPEIQTLLALGYTALGENKAQVLEEKAQLFSAEKKICWHFIGHLQTNKIKKVLPFADYIHSIDSLSLAKAVDRLAGLTGRRSKLLLEVNISGEESKHGFSPDVLLEVLPSFDVFENVDIIGLMTMAPLGAPDEVSRKIFRSLVGLGETINSKKFDKIRITEYSMGMSDDFRIALEEGATIVRIGSAIFN